MEIQYSIESLKQIELDLTWALSNNSLQINTPRLPETHRRRGNDFESTFIDLDCGWHGDSICSCRTIQNSLCRRLASFHETRMSGAPRIDPAGGILHEIMGLKVITIIENMVVKIAGNRRYGLEAVQYRQKSIQISPYRTFIELS